MDLLVVDDEHLVRWFLERALTKKGYNIVTASSVRDAMEKLSQGHFDLVITDLKMPEEDGTVLIEKLREMPQRPKILVCSAYLKEGQEEEFRKEGIFVLRKPFRMQELDAVLQKALG